MKIEYKPLTIEDVQFITQLRREQIEDIQKIINDPDKENRLYNQECVLCYYNPKIGGAAMTQSECSICMSELHSSNTNIDHLCKECAVKHKLCKHCSADINYKNRKVL